MEIETSKLSGAALDWAVAQCENHTAKSLWLIGPPHTNTPYLQLNDASLGNNDIYSPSTDWSQGGPIIEREKITVGPYWIKGYEKFCAYFGLPSEDDPDALGPTYLIAAMRCYVAVQLGDIVDVPEELI